MARFAWARRRRVWIPVVVVAAALLLLPRLVPGGAVRDLVAGRLQAALGHPVTIGAVKARLLPSPGVELRDLNVGAGGVGPLVSLTADRITLTLAFGPLLRRQVEVTSLDLEAPRLVVQVPGASASGGAAAKAPAIPAGPPLKVNVRRLTITQGAVAVRRADGAPLLELAGLGETMTASLSPGGDLTLSGTTTLDTLRFHAPQGTLGEGLPITWRKDLRWEGGAKRLTINASTLSVGGLPVAVTGTVDSVGAARPVADLAFTGGPAQVASLAGFLPPFLAPSLEGVRSSGEVAVSGHLRGPLGPPAGPRQPLPFAYELVFDLSGGRVSAPALAAPLSGIEVHLRAHDDVVELTRMAAATRRSRLDVAGTMSSLLTTPRVDLDVTADVDLAEAMALQPPQPGQPDLSGRFSGRVMVRGPINPPTGLALAGGGRLHDLKMSGPELRPSIDRIDGPVRFDGQQLIADGVVYRQGTTDLTLTGTVDNYLALVPAAKVAPPAVLAVAVDGRMLDADQYAAPRGQKKEAAGPESGLARLALLTGRADVTMARLLTRGHELQDVRGTVRLDRGRLTLEGVKATLYGGRADLGGTVDLSDPAHGRMDLEVTLAGVQAQELSRRAVAMSRFARLGGLVTGLVDGNATLKGALDDTFGLDLATFTTKGQIDIRQARLAGSPLQKKLATLLAAPQLEAVAVSDWFQPFRIEDGKLFVDGLRLSAAGIGVRAAGWQALDGTVALGVEMTVPQALAQGLRAKLPPAVAALLFDGSGAPLVVPVGLSGRWDDPRVELDAGSLANAAQDRARAQVGREADKVRQQVDRQVDQVKQQAAEQVADKAAQALGRLTGQSGDTAAAGADTAKATGVLGDEVKSILKGLRGRKGK